MQQISSGAAGINLIYGGGGGAELEGRGRFMRGSEGIEGRTGGQVC